MVSTNKNSLTKLAYIVNTMIAFFLMGLSLLFYVKKMEIIFWISFALIFVYLGNYVLIQKGHMYLFVIIIYTLISLYMDLATICAGLDSGFQLYALSMIALIFYLNYFSEKLYSRPMHPILYSMFIIISYFFCIVFTIVHGPIYSLDRTSATTLMVLNSLWVMGLLLAYSIYMINLVQAREKDLKKQAQQDKLTGIYNRHFMLNELESLQQTGLADRWIAMLDVDDFKRINDNYGHNAGDYVLKRIAEIVCTNCAECLYARWGGEEFIITAKKPVAAEGLLEKIRQAVAEEAFIFEEKRIAVSVTIGASYYRENQTIDLWIQSADKGLYKGKASGKNTVVIE